VTNVVFIHENMHLSVGCSDADVCLCDECSCCVCPPGVGGEHSGESRSSGEGLRLQELQSAGRGAFSLPRLLQTPAVGGHQSLVRRAGILPGVRAGKRPAPGTTDRDDARAK
ncbi:hypothetical protein M9458_050311, partial [Cirrhinus mrigala]